VEPLPEVLAATSLAARAAQQEPSSTAAMASLQVLLEALQPRMPSFEAPELLSLLALLRPLAEEAAAAGGTDAAETLEYLCGYAGQLLEQAAVDYSRLEAPQLLEVIAFASVSQMVGGWRRCCGQRTALLPRCVLLPPAARAACRALRSHLEPARACSPAGRPAQLAPRRRCRQRAAGWRS
jgi:hypothetical protein